MNYELIYRRVATQNCVKTDQKIGTERYIRKILNNQDQCCNSSSYLYT